MLERRKKLYNRLKLRLITQRLLQKDDIQVIDDYIQTLEKTITKLEGTIEDMHRFIDTQHRIILEGGTHER